MKITTTMSLLAAAGGLCLGPAAVLRAADADQTAAEPTTEESATAEPATEGTAVEAKDTMSLSIVVAKGGG